MAMVVFNWENPHILEICSSYLRDVNTAYPMNQLKKLWYFLKFNLVIILAKMTLNVIVTYMGAND